MHYRFFTYFTFSVIISCSAFAQLYNTGAARGNLEFKQIQTEHFQLIYPKGTDSLAQVFANNLENYKPYLEKQSKHKLRRIPVIMQTESVISNAYVSWAPRRMEVVTLSPQDNYSQDWLSQLAIHEYSHVAHMNLTNTGLVRIARYFGGEIWVGAAAGYYPLWFLEGEAVTNETALTNTGRGREPSFSRHLRAIEGEKDERYSYDQSYLGSYKHFTPSYYHYGYHMVGVLKTQFGESVINNTIKRVANFPFFTPFYRGLKNNTDLSKVKLYDSSFTYLSEQWNREIPEKPDSFYEIPTQFNSRYVNYSFLNQMEDGSLLAMRRSPDDISRWVKITDKEESTLLKQGAFYSSNVDYSNKYMVWEDVEYDPRWEQRSWSLVKVYDFATGSVHTLKNRTRHFSPAISPDNIGIAVIQIDEANQHSIEIYPVHGGEVTQKISINGTISNLEWADAERLIYIETSSKGKKVIGLNLVDNATEIIFDAGFYSISNIHYRNNKLFFTYTLDGRENIYQLDLHTYECHRLTDSKYGADFATISADGEYLIYSNYTIGGYKPVKMAYDLTLATPLEEIQPYKYQLAEKLAEQKNINFQDTVFKQIEYKAQPYNRALNAINVHSFLPFYTDFDNFTDINQPVYFGLTLMSQSKLSDFTSYLSIYAKNGKPWFSVDISMDIFFPKISLKYTLGGGAEMGGTPNSYLIDELDNYQRIGLELSVPLNYNTSYLNRLLNFSVEYNASNYYYADENTFSQQDFDYVDGSTYYYKGNTGMEYQFQALYSRKKANRDLYSPLGLSFFALYHQPVKSFNPFVKGEPASTLYASSSVWTGGTSYLPGIFRHHSILLSCYYWNRFIRSDNLPPGFQKQNSTFTLSKRYSRFSAKYSAPVLYPDFSIGPVVYTKRIILTGGYQNVNNLVFKRESQVLSSNKINDHLLGIEIAADMNFFRFFMPVRPSFEVDYSLVTGEFLFGFNMVNTFSF